MTAGPRPVRRDALLLGLLVAALLAWGALYVLRTSVELPDGERVFTLWDDAMISMQYARNLQGGAGLVWNPGEAPVQGFSNPGVTLLMAAVHALPLSPERVSAAVQGLALLLLAALPLLLWQLARGLFPDARGVAWGSALGAALCAPVAIWTLQGSDVGFVSLWLVAACLSATGRPLHGKPLLALVAIAPWIRADVAIYVPFLLYAVADTAKGRRLARQGTALLGISLLTWAAFAVAYYGDPLPNTWYLKATGSPRKLVLLSGLGELLWWLPRLALPVLLAGVAVVAAGAERRLLALAGVVLVAQAYSVWVGGDFVFGWGSRFAVPSLPILGVLATAGLDRLAGRLAPVHAARPAAVATLGAALMWLASPSLAAREWLDPRAPTLLHAENESNLRFARYLRDHTHPATSLGAHWGGIPPYFSGRPAIDVLGKSDRHIARLSVPRFIPGHSKWDWDYVMNERRPDVLRAPSRGLAKREDFRRGYLRVETPDPEVRFFLHRSALGRLRDPRARVIDLVSGRRYRIEPAETAERVTRPRADARPALRSPATR